MNGSTSSGAEETPRTSVKRRAKDAVQEASFAYHAKMVTYLLAWSLVSGLIIILNNWVMHYDGFPFPIALSATGPLFSWVVSAVLVASGHTRLERQMTFKTWMQQVFPIGFFTAVTYATGNELYLFMSVSFIQMMKSMSPIVVLFLLVAFKLDVLTTPKLVAVAAMSAGMLVACHAEPSFSAFGLALMVVGEASEAMRMVFFQQLLGAAQFGLIEGLFYTCPANFFFLCVGVAVFEEGEIRKPENYERVLRNPGPYLCIAMLGFLVILTTLGVIQTCGSLTFKAAGQVRNIGIIVVSMAVFGDRVTVAQALGYAVNVVGFCLYQVVKTREDLQKLREEFAREALDGDEASVAAGGGADAHLDNFEKLCGDDGKFTKTGKTTGELHLYSLLYHMRVSTFKTEFSPKLTKFIEQIEALEGVKKCIANETKFGELGDYVLPVP